MGAGAMTPGANPRAKFFVILRDKRAPHKERKLRLFPQGFSGGATEGG